MDESLFMFMAVRFKTHGKVCLRIAIGNMESVPAAYADLEPWLSAAGADLAILPEGYLSGAGLPPCVSDGEPIAKMRNSCRATAQALLFGYNETCSGEVFNSQQLITAKGVAIANYRCTHPAQSHHGTGRWLTIVPYLANRLGILLGDDLMAGEIWRALALSQASCIIWSGAQYENSGAILQTRARENGIAVVGGDRSGVYGFGPGGQRLDIHPSSGYHYVSIADLAPTGPPVSRQPILYRRLVSEGDASIDA